MKQKEENIITETEESIEYKTISENLKYLEIWRQTLKSRNTLSFHHPSRDLRYINTLEPVNL